MEQTEHEDRNLPEDIPEDAGIPTVHDLVLRTDYHLVNKFGYDSVDAFVTPNLYKAEAFDRALMVTALRGLGLSFSDYTDMKMTDSVVDVMYSRVDDKGGQLLSTAVEAVFATPLDQYTYGQQMMMLEHELFMSVLGDRMAVIMDKYQDLCTACDTIRMPQVYVAGYGD